MDNGHETNVRGVTVILGNLAADFQREQYDDRTKHSQHDIEENYFSHPVYGLAAELACATKPNRAQAMYEISPCP